MSTPDESPRALRRLFRRSLVADLDALFQALDTRSRMTVFRRLKEIGYLSSYSHTGRYYTLSDIPRFDEHGLWLYRGVGFARAGTLKRATVELVRTSEAGRTHPELEQLLRVRVHNTLLDLVEEEEIGREPLGGLYIYVSPEEAQAVAQLARRREILSGQAKVLGPLPSTTVIEVLVEAIQAEKIPLAPALVAKRLAGRGIAVSVEQVEQVFIRHGLDVEKKTARSPSRRSKR